MCLGCLRHPKHVSGTPQTRVWGDYIFGVQHYFGVRDTTLGRLQICLWGEVTCLVHQIRIWCTRHVFGVSEAPQIRIWDIPDACLGWLHLWGATYVVSSFKFHIRQPPCLPRILHGKNPCDKFNENCPVLNIWPLEWTHCLAIRCFDHCGEGMLQQALYNWVHSLALKYLV